MYDLFPEKTRRGLNLRAVGESPATADAAGINVSKYKYIATVTGAAIAGLGGLYLSWNISEEPGLTTDLVTVDGWQSHWLFSTLESGSCNLGIIPVWRTLYFIYLSAGTDPCNTGTLQDASLCGDDHCTCDHK